LYVQLARDGVAVFAAQRRPDSRSRRNNFSVAGISSAPRLPTIVIHWQGDHTESSVAPHGQHRWRPTWRFTLLSRSWLVS
jgi:hypothetical protein